MGSAAKQRTLPENSRRSRTNDDLLRLIPRARRLQRFVMYWGFGEHQYDTSPCISLLAHGIFCSERRLTKLNVHESRRSLRLPERASAMLAQGYAKIGQTDKARNLLSQLERLSSHRYVGHVSYAVGYSPF